MNRISIDRLLTFVTLLLIIPFTFYWSTGEYGYSSSLSGFDPVSEALRYATADSITTFSILSYITLFFALFVRRSEGLRSLLVLLSAAFHLLMLAQYSILLTLQLQYGIVDLAKSLFFSIPSRFPFQLFTTMALISWTFLIARRITLMKVTLRAFFGRLSGVSTSQRVLTIVAITLWSLISALIIFMAVDQYLSAARSFDSGFQLPLLIAAVAILFKAVISIFVLSLLLISFIMTFSLWRTEIFELNQTLRDFRLSHYVTRLISGYLYWLYFTAIVAALAVVTPMQTLIAYEERRMNMGLQPENFLILLAGPLLGAVVGYLLILALRLIFELLIALVHIAQNTRRTNQLT